MAFPLRLLSCQSQSTIRQAFHILLLSQQLFICFCSIQKIITEVCAQFTQLLLYFIEPLFSFTFQSNSSQHKISQLTIHNPLLCLAQPLPGITFLDRFKSLIDWFGLRQAEHHFHLLRLHFFHCFTKLFAIFDRLQMGHGAPGPTKSIHNTFQRFHKPGPGRLHILFQFIDRLIRLIN